jgi:hypothetical protein
VEAQAGGSSCKVFAGTDDAADSRIAPNTNHEVVSYLVFFE